MCSTWVRQTGSNPRPSRPHPKLRPRQANDQSCRRRPEAAFTAIRAQALAMNRVCPLRDIGDRVWGKRIVNGVGRR